MGSGPREPLNPGEWSNLKDPQVTAITLPWKAFKTSMPEGSLGERKEEAVLLMVTGATLLCSAQGLNPHLHPLLNP